MFNLNKHNNSNHNLNFLIIIKYLLVQTLDKLKYPKLQVKQFDDVNKQVAHYT
jgi:hypothetical protein